jgi:uncharacterized delta-60 repeat protein
MAGKDQYAYTPLHIYSDNSVIIGGWKNIGTSNQNAMEVWKFLADGGLDPNFSTAGLDLPNGTIAHGMAVQADGRIVLVGSTTRFGPQQDLTVVRLNVDGSLDTSFGSAGVVYLSVTSNDWGNGVAIQTDQKIVISGYAGNSAPNTLLVRLLSTGALDTSFGNNAGYYRGSEGKLTGVALQSDGRIIVHTVSSVLRYTTAGALDTSFGTGGATTLALGAANTQLFGIAIQSNNAVVISGRTRNVTNNEAYIARLIANGQIDTSFAVNGKYGSGAVIIGPGSPVDTSNVVVGLAVQSDGAIVVSGESTNTSPGAILFVARVTSAGIIDVSFGTAGLATAFSYTGASYGELRAVGIRSNGNIVTGGYAQAANLNSAEEFVVLAELLTSGVLRSNACLASVLSASSLLVMGVMASVLLVL